MELFHCTVLDLVVLVEMGDTNSAHALESQCTFSVISNKPTGDLDAPQLLQTKLESVISDHRY